MGWQTSGWSGHAHTPAPDPERASLPEQSDIETIYQSNQDRNSDIKAIISETKIENLLN